MMDSLADDLEAVLPESLREFVRVTCDIEPHPEFPRLCASIGAAFQRLQGVPFRWTEIDLILTDDPPKVMTACGLMVLAPKKGIAAMTFEKTIVLRARVLLSAPSDFQVIAVLEELTHALLNVQDESLAAWIVSFLYSDQVAYQNGSYVPAASFQPHWPPVRKDWNECYLSKDFDEEIFEQTKEENDARPPS
jgi:hypothetical protein